MDVIMHDSHVTSCDRYHPSPYNLSGNRRSRSRDSGLVKYDS